jgi:hypothetical protein
MIEYIEVIEFAGFWRASFRRSRPNEQRAKCTDHGMRPRQTLHVAEPTGVWIGSIDGGRGRNRPHPANWQFDHLAPNDQYWCLDRLD